MEQVRLAVARGDPRALELVRRLLLRRPGSVDGRRQRQNLRLARGDGWQVYEEARADHERDPLDPSRLYLLARVIPDRVVQRDLFRRSLRLDPSFYFGAYGLSVVSLELGDDRAAESAARRALAIRPGDRAARVLLAGALAKQGRSEEAEDLYRELLAGFPADVRVVLVASEFLERAGRAAEGVELLITALGRDPGREPFLIRLWTLLDRPGMGPQEIVAAARTAEEALSLDPGTGAARLLRARTRMLGNDARGALADLEAALVAGARRAALREDIIEAAVEAGEFARALAAWEEGLPRSFLDAPGNLRRPVMLRLQSALRKAAEDPGDVDRLTEVARSLSAAGFDRPAAAAAGQAMARAPGREDVALLHADLAAWGRFVREVETRIRESYVAFDAGEEGPDLSEMIDSLRTASEDLLGRDVLSGLPVDSYAFVGSVARTDREGAAQDWGEHGTLLVIGQRAGGPVEGTMIRLLGRFPEEEERGVPYALSVGEGQKLPSYLETRGSSIAGFALPGWIGMNLDVAIAWEEETERLAAAVGEGPLWPAPDAERRRSLWFPGGVRARLAKRCLADGDDGTFLAALAHEQGHLLDADRHVPFIEHLPKLLFEIVRHGFSTAAIEVTLEHNAEVYSLANSPRPRHALLNAMSFLPWRRSTPPHSIAFYDLIESLVAEIDRHPERYPSIDRSFNILQQLDRLTDEELSRLLK